MPLRIHVTTGAGKTNDQTRRVGLTEVQLFLSKTEFPVNISDELSSMIVNGVTVDVAGLTDRVYPTQALLVDDLQLVSDVNAAYTVLPAYEDVVRILTESEDHTARGVYEIRLGAPASAEDSSRDYPREYTTATAASAENGEGQEGLAEYVVDAATNTIWHTAWDENLSDSLDRRWIQLELEEATLLDALRYLPRDNIGNGMVTKYRVEVSLNGAEWTTVSEGDWAQDTQWKIALFDQPVEAKYVRLYGVETRGANGDIPNKFMSAAEVRVRRADQLIDLSQAQVTLAQESYPYTGQAIVPMPTVTLDSRQLRYGVDYLLSYQDNVEPGTAMVTVEGIVQYRGQVEKTFRISAQNMAQSYTPVFVKTYAGQAPQLPGTVTAQVGKDREVELPVVWEAIDPSQYAWQGTFTVEGTVEDQTLKITATVNVLESIGVESLSAVVVEQQLPTLPGEVAVYFADGSSEQHPVTWTLNEQDFAQAGTVTVNGSVTVGGKTLTTTAKIRVSRGVRSLRIWR